MTQGSENISSDNRDEVQEADQIDSIQRGKHNIAP